MAIAQQLQAETASQSNSGTTQSVTLSSGSNRYMVVALVAEHASSQAAPTSVTYGGNALALITDGSVTASQTSTLAGVFLYRLLEADMPADGANNLTVSWPSTTNYVMGWWILTGVQQANADDVKVLAQTTTATSITVTLDAGNTTDAVICAAYSNNNPSIAITISGAAVTEDFDVDIASTARGAAGTDLPAVASGTIACVATTTSTNRRIIVAVRLAEAAATDVDATLALTGVPFTASGSGTATTPTGDPPAFIELTTGGSTRSVTVPSGTTLMVVTVLGSGASPGRVGDYDGVDLDVATNTNDFVSILYMLDPPVGTATLAVTSGLISTVVAAMYSGDNLAFVSGQEASLSSDSYTTAGAALIVHGISFSDSGDHTPESGTNERHDTSGNWYGDRILASGATVDVGTTDGSDPDYAGAIFSAVASGSVDGTAALTGVPFAGSGTGSAAIQSSLALTGVPFAGLGTGTANIAATLALTGVPFAGAGAGTAKVEATVALTGVPFAGAGAASASIQGALGLTGVPFVGSGVGVATNDATLVLTSTPFAGSGAGSAAIQGSLALTGVPFAGLGTGTARVEATLGLTGTPFAGAGTGEAKNQATLALTGIPFASTGAGTAAVQASVGLTGVPFSAAGTGTHPFTASLALTGVPFAATGVGSASNNPTANLPLTGAPFESSGSGTAKVASSLALTSVPFEGSGAGAASWLATLGLTGVPFSASGVGTSGYQAQLALSGTPFTGTGAGQALNQALLGLVSAPFQASGSGSAINLYEASLQLVGVPFVASGIGDVGTDPVDPTVTVEVLSGSIEVQAQSATAVVTVGAGFIAVELAVGPSVTVAALSATISVEEDDG